MRVSWQVRVRKNDRPLIEYDRVLYPLDLSGVYPGRSGIVGGICVLENTWLSLALSVSLNLRTEQKIGKALTVHRGTHDLRAFFVQKTGLGSVDSLAQNLSLSIQPDV